MSAFPMRGGVEEPDREPSIVSLTDADAVFDALGSETAREIVAALSESPAPPTDLAERTGTTVQNVHYHLDRLADGGIVDVVDTWYSSRGVEMDVYALAAQPVVVCVGDPDEALTDAPDTSGSDAALAPSD